LINLIGIGGIDISFDTTGATDVGAGVVSEASICEVATASKHVDTSDGKLALQHESASQNTANTPGYMVGELSQLPAGLK